MKKNFIFLLFFTFFSLTGIAQDKSYQLSSHILDIHTGKPAPGVTISLSRQDTSGRWSVIEERKTDENGRVKDFLEAVEFRLIDEALQRADGVKNQAAELLGIKRTTLIEKLKKKNG